MSKNLRGLYTFIYSPNILRLSLGNNILDFK